MNTFNLIRANHHKIKLSHLGVILSLILILSSIILRPSINAFADSSNQRVYDNAGLLTSDEIESLEAAALELGVKYNTDIYIITDEDSDGKSREEYMEDFADAKAVENSTIIFVNMESGNRGFEIQGYGKDEFIITGSRIEDIIEVIKPLLSNGDFYSAFGTFLSEIEYYYEKGPQRSIFSEPWLQLIISLAIGGVVVGAMAFNSGGRITVNERTYLDASHSRIVARRDDYIRTATTKTRRPQNNNRSGGGGISSGGRSHSGGGSSF